MPQAVIDVGTNTLILLILKKLPSGKLKVLHDEAIITRLGQGLTDHHFFQNEALKRCYQAFDHFSKICKQHKRKKITAIGTAACRIAANIDVLRLKLKQEYNIDLKIISGNEEAEYTFKSVWQDFGKTNSKFIVVDIGGGSTEIITGPTRAGSTKPDSLISLPFGSVRLTEQFISTDPISKKEFNHLVKSIRTKIKDELDSFYDDDMDLTPHQFVATAGTATTIFAIHHQMEKYDPKKVNGGKITKENLESVINLLASKTTIERQKLPGVQPLRADVILTGAVLLYELLNYFQKEEIIISDRGLRYGYLAK
jgi:exopolyphosphatase/guanosine-5'-triphosphate,3'-diphosphate pyrophosphatase